MRVSDPEVRLRAFQFLDELRSVHGDLLPRGLLLQGFLLGDTRVPLVGPQGIFKPRVLAEMPLSITTVPEVEGRPRPYDDEQRDDGLVRYRYRGTDPLHHENVGLRTAMTNGTPLIYFYGVSTGRYEAVYPVYVVEDDPATLSFTVAFDQRAGDLTLGSVAEDSVRFRRQYVTAATQQRLHQRSFRERVLAAYRCRCSICRLGHEPLLDAAHILPDRHPKGEPWVSNGIAMCKLHHAAFDNQLLGVRPDLVIEVRESIRKEEDGPMLLHGLQESHGQALRILPQRRVLRPSPDFLEERYEMFRSAS